MTTELAPQAHANVGMYDPNQWKHLDIMASAFADSGLVPKHFQGKRADCLIALSIAQAMGESPLALMQSMHIVHGTAGFSAKWMIARVNKHPAFKGRLRFRVEDLGIRQFGNAGKLRDLCVTAYATDAETEEEVSETVTMQMAVDEGWAKNSKYQSMPEVMLRYRAATFFVRFNCPELLFGMRTADELEDIAVADGVGHIVQAPQISQDAPRTLADLPDAGPTMEAGELTDGVIKVALRDAGTLEGTDNRAVADTGAAAAERKLADAWPTPPDRFPAVPDLPDAVRNAAVQAYHHAGGDADRFRQAVKDARLDPRKVGSWTALQWAAVVENLMASGDDGVPA